MLAMICFYRETYASESWLLYDNYFTLVYLSDYVLRLYVDGIYKVMTAIGKIELLMSSALFIICFYFFFIGIGSSASETAFDIVKLSVILRSFRIVTAYQTTQSMTKVAIDAWTGFIPLILYLLTSLLIYAVLGMIIFGDHTMSTGNEFLDNHYNFKSIQNSIITLLIIGTFTT
jgi:Ion transport protein